MRSFLSIKYDEAVTPARFEGLQADDIDRALARHMPPGLSDFCFFLHSSVNFLLFTQESLRIWIRSLK